ncbi:MAG TPA: hypothetical protein VHB97_07115, partial [Polyangia bacterium]|nr:hypothetical protein [Polyangia bacterium]
MTRACVLVALVAFGCAPTVRATDYYAAPLHRPASTRAHATAIEARWRVQAAPAGCAATGAPILF